MIFISRVSRILFHIGQLYASWWPARLRRAAIWRQLSYCCRFDWPVSRDFEEARDARGDAYMMALRRRWPAVDMQYMISGEAIYAIRCKPLSINNDVMLTLLPYTSKGHDIDATAMSSRECQSGRAWQVSTKMPASYQAHVAVYFIGACRTKSTAERNNFAEPATRMIS